MQLTQKETSLLQDLAEQEQICFEKYNNNLNNANDQQLKNIFSQISAIENQHLKTINQILSGTVPAIQSENNTQLQQSFTANYTANDSSQESEKTPIFLPIYFQLKSTFLQHTILVFSNLEILI